MKFFKNFFLNQNIINIVFFGFFIRTLTLILYENPFFGDTQTHKQIGIEIFSGKLVTSSIHMPGYGVYMYLSNFIINSNIGFIFTDIIISLATIYVIYLLSLEIFNDEILAKITSFIFAFYPFSVFYSISGLNETLYVFLLLLSILNLYRNKYFYGIIFIVLSIYIKSISFVIGPILILIFIFWKKKSFKTSFKFLGLYFFILSVLMSPWWVHNYKKYHSFVITNLAFGYHIYAGNNVMNKTGGGIGGVDVDHELILGPSRLGHDYFKSNKFFKAEAYNFIKENPKRFINLTTKKFFRFWRPYPYAEEYKSFFYKFISLISYGSILIFLFIFFVKYSKKYFNKIIPLIFTSVVIVFIYTITIVSIRYRYPIEPLMIILSSYSIKRDFFKI